MNKSSPIEVFALQDEIATLFSMRGWRGEGPRWESDVREGSEVCGYFSEKRIDPFYSQKKKPWRPTVRQGRKAGNIQQFPSLTKKGYLLRD